MVRMRYAIDAHAIGRRLTGNEVYARSLVEAFAAVDKRSEFYTYISLKEAEACIPQRFHVRYVSGNPLARLGYGLAAQVRRDRPDVLHVQYTAPLFCPVPVVVSIHDVSFLERPEYFTAVRRKQLELTVARTARTASRIITGSEFSRDSILRAYKVDPEKVVVVSDAASPFFRAVSREAAIRKVRDAHGINGPFVLSVGDLQPRKNHIGLIRAFADLIRSSAQLPHRLVLAGQDTWFGPKVREAARNSGVEDRISFLGFVSDDQLLQLYNACDCFAFPSYYEGFGIPILEAMACGRAVVCSNTSSIPEVADGAGLLFDPYRTEEITRAMRDVLVDPALRQRMERLGTQRAALFTWRETARLTLDIYGEVAERAAPERSRSRVVSAQTSRK